MCYRHPLCNSYTIRPFFSPHCLFPPSFVSLGRVLGFSFVVSFPYSFVRPLTLLFSLVFVLLISLRPFLLFLALAAVLSRLPCGCSFSLSRPSSVSAHLLRCFWLLLLFLSPRRFSAHLLLFPPHFSCPRFTIRCHCCAGRSPLLVACLPSPVVRGAVPCAYFLLLLFSFACAFLGGGCYYVRFPHSLGFFSLSPLASLVLSPLGSSLDLAYLTFSLARSPSFLGLSLPSSDISAGVAPSLRLGGRLLWLRY